MESAPKTTWAAGSDERATLVGRKRLEGGKGSAVAERRRDAHTSEISCAPWWRCTGKGRKHGSE